MPKDLPEISIETARRIAIRAQGLDKPRFEPTADGLLELVRQLGCLQLDPISVVEKPHLLIPWSRTGDYDRAEMDRLLWERKGLFSYWAHAASLVLTEDYPIHRVRMKRWGKGRGVWERRLLDWMTANKSFRTYILREIRTRGPLMARDLEDRSSVPWPSEGWTAGQNVARMLDLMLAKGDIVIAGRKGLQRIWDLSERWFPEWTPSETISLQEATKRATLRSIRALGVASATHIRNHFIRGEYPGLAKILDEFERTGVVQRVAIKKDGAALREPWYAMTETLDGLSAIEKEWEPRTTLLSPFDNLICDRKRTQLLFDFDYTIEIYVPKAKRRFGYYVLPILQGDNLVGRIDPKFDRKTKVMTINGIYEEKGLSAAQSRAVKESIKRLGNWLGAQEVVMPRSA